MRKGSESAEKMALGWHLLLGHLCAHSHQAAQCLVREGDKPTLAIGSGPIPTCTYRLSRRTGVAM